MGVSFFSFFWITVDRQVHRLKNNRPMYHISFLPFLHTSKFLLKYWYCLIQINLVNIICDIILFQPQKQGLKKPTLP